MTPIYHPPAEQAIIDQDLAFLAEYAGAVWLFAAQGWQAHGPGVVLMQRPRPGEMVYLPLTNILATKLPETVRRSVQYVIDPRQLALLVFTGDEGNYRAHYVVSAPKLKGGSR